MKCLVFGAGGYIGRHLVPALRAAGHSVVVYGHEHGVEGRRSDLADAHQLADVDWAVDRVFHFAGVTGTAASFQNFATYVDGNEVALLNVLEGIRHSGYRPRIIFPSSRLVYKGCDQPLRETAVLEAKTIYAANKIACELYLRSYSNAFDIPHTIFRICVPYGSMGVSRYSFGTIGNFIDQAIKSGSIRLYGNGGVRRSFTHIADLCRLVIEGANHSGFENQTLNVPGEGLSLLEAAQLVAAHMGASIEFTDWPSLDLRLESGSTEFDGSKMLALLGTDLTWRMDQWAALLDRNHTG